MRQVAIEFHVVNRRLPHFACPHANHAVVGVKQFPCSSVQRQLQVLEQTAHVPQTSVIGVGPPNGFEVADDDQSLRLTGRAVKRERCIVVFIAQHTSFNEVVLEVVREHQNIHAVGVSKQSEAHLGIVGCGVQPYRAF